MKWMIILVIGIRQMSEQRYADDKPRDCRYCYFWNESSEVCERQICYYLLPEEEKAVLLLPVGYAAEGAVPTERHGTKKPIEETVKYL